jgi:hypothetical protein
MTKGRKFGAKTNAQDTAGIRKEKPGAFALSASADGIIVAHSDCKTHE